MLTRSLPRPVTGLLECFRGCFAPPSPPSPPWWSGSGPSQECTPSPACWSLRACPRAGSTPGPTGSSRRRAGRLISSAYACWTLCAACWSLPGRRCGRCWTTPCTAAAAARRSGRLAPRPAWHWAPRARLGGPGRAGRPALVSPAVCVRPILARLWRPRHTAGRLGLGCNLVRLVCQHLSTRRIDLVCDGAYAGRALHDLPGQEAVTTHLRADARLFRLPAPRRAGMRGQPPTKGSRLPDLTILGGMVTTPFALAPVTRYDRRGTAAIVCFTCLWPSVFGAHPVHVVLVRDPPRPTASTWRWCSPTFQPPRPGWLNATPPGGRWRSGSARPAKTLASARPAVVPAQRSSEPCRSGWSATAWRSSGTPARPCPHRRCCPPRTSALVQDQARPVSGRRAHKAPPGAAGRAISPGSCPLSRPYRKSCRCRQRGPLPEP